MSAWPLSLITQPTLILIGVSIAAYLVGMFLYERFNRTLLLHPVLVGMVTANLLLAATGTDYATYFEHNKLLHLLLGPAVVCLAVPIYEHIGRARETIVPLFLVTIMCGILIIISTVLIANAAGLSGEMVDALITRSITAPIALAISQQVGGNAGLVILVIFLTGLIGVVVSPYVFKILAIEDDAVKGFTLGLTAHTFGVARAVEISGQAAAFATLGMGITGCIAAFVIPFVMPYINN